MAEGDPVAAGAETPIEGTPSAVAPQAQAPAPAEDAAPAEGTPLAPAPAAAAPAATDPAWVAPRIDRLTRDKKQAEEQAVALRARLVAAGIDPDAPVVTPAAGGTPPAPATPIFDAAEIDRRAQVLADNRAFTERCNSIAAEGVKTHSDFKETIARFNLVGGLNPDLIEAAIEVGNPHELLYSLGKNLDEASRILALAPAARGVALSKFAAEAGKRALAAVSTAPAPASSEVGGGAPPSTDEPSAKDDSATWFAKREKQLGIGGAA